MPFRPASGQFIPWPLAAIAHVDAVEQQGQGGGTQPQLPVPDIRPFRPREGTALQPFCQNPEAAPVEVEQLEDRATPVGEGEDRAALRVFLELGRHRVVEAMERLAHVAGLHGHEDFEAAGKAQHGRDSSRIHAAASGTTE